MRDSPVSWPSPAISGATAMPRARFAASVVALAALAAGVVVVPEAVSLAVAAAAVVLQALWWPASRAWLAWLAGVPGGVSLVATLGHRLLGWPGIPSWGVVETVLQCVLVGLVSRWAPVRAAMAGGALAGMAAATTVLRATDEANASQLESPEVIYAVAFWALGPILAAVVGLYLRYLDNQRTRAVVAAQQSQRMELAHDLHDYVAHDVSEMIAQAQAAQVVVDDDQPVQAALRRIEEAGLRAMASMDRTVRVFGSPEPGPGPGPEPGPEGGGPEVRLQPGMAELPELVERFATAGPAEVRLRMDPGLDAQVPRELAGTVYRVVVEALTNVRRHAPAATLVEVLVEVIARQEDDVLLVVVTNNAGGMPPTDLGRRGGLGLPGLTERVRALSGSFEAGPSADGWQVRVRLPLSAHGEVGARSSA